MKPVLPRRFVAGDNVTVSLRMPQGLKDALIKYATLHGHSFSQFVQDGLDQWAAAHADAYFDDPENKEYRETGI